MIWLISLLAIGLVVGWLMGLLTEGRGGPAPMWSAVLGIVGSILGGFLFAMVGARLVGEGPLYIASLIAAGVGAVVLLLFVMLIKR